VVNGGTISASTSASIQTSGDLSVSGNGSLLSSSGNVQLTSSTGNVLVSQNTINAPVVGVSGTGKSFSLTTTEAIYKSAYSCRQRHNSPDSGQQNFDVISKCQCAAIQQHRHHYGTASSTEVLAPLPAQ